MRRWVSQGMGTMHGSIAGGWECQYFVRGHVSVTYTLPSAMLDVGYVGVRGRGPCHAVIKVTGSAGAEYGYVCTHAHRWVGTPV